MSTPDSQTPASRPDRQILDRLLDIIAQAIALRRQYQRAVKSRSTPPQSQK